MSTINYQIAKSRANTKAKLLLEIDLIGTGTTYNASKTIYLSDDYVEVDGITYEGIVQSWGGMDIELFNEGISAISDYSITLQNERLMFFEDDKKFSDIFDDYYFAGSICRIYQWFDELSSKDDAELIFNGTTKQPKFDLSEIKFTVVENENLNQDLPFDIVTLNNFANAPDESINNPLPIVYGDDWIHLNGSYKQCAFSPCIETDKLLKTFYISEHQTKETPALLTSFFLYVENVKAYGLIKGSNFSVTNNSGGSRVTFNDNIYYRILLVPRVKGGQYDSAVSDYANALDFLTTTSVTLSDDENFYLKLDEVPNIGHLEALSSQTIDLKIEVENVTGTAVGGNYGYLKYYNPGYDAGTGKASTAVNITGNGTFTLSLISTRDAHGTSDDEDDQNDPWTWDELSSIEFGITVENNAGDPISFDLNYIYLDIDYIPLVYKKPDINPNLRARRVAR